MLAAAFVISTAISLSAASGAPAAQSWRYCGFVFAPYPTACYALNPHTFDLNRATYPGSGNLTVCEGAYIDNFGFYGPQRCGNRYAGSGYDFQGDTLLKRGYNHHWGANPHTVNGVMWTGWF